MKKVSTYFSPKDKVARVLIGFIDRCETTIDAAIYCITHDGIVNALIRASERGVRIRIITDRTQAAGKWSDDERLEEAKIPIMRGGTAFRGSMHNKFVVGDGAAVGTGSFNWTKSANLRNDENFVIIRVQYTVKEYQQEFDRLWKRHTSKKIKNK